MAKSKAPTAYQEGSGWSMRQRFNGQDIYVSGHTSKTAAKAALQQLVNPLKKRGQPKGLGPLRTTLAQALQDVGLERLPFIKGAEQEA